MKVKRLTAKTNNTKCHGCWIGLKGVEYTRFSGFGTALYGKDSVMSICDKCLDDAVALKNS